MSTFFTVPSTTTNLRVSLLLLSTENILIRFIDFFTYLKPGNNRIMNRVYVYKDKSSENGKLMVLENTLEEFKSKISALFDIAEENVKIYSSNGCEIHDLRVIRDDEKVYLLPGVKQNSDDCDKIENSSKKDEDIENAKSKVVSDWITLNVGGKHFTTSRSTLLAKEPLSMLARMFADDNNMYLMNPSATDETGAYLIDRSPEYFEPILNYLRHGNVVLDNHVNPKGVLEEAIFYGKFKIICDGFVLSNFGSLST